MKQILFISDTHINSLAGLCPPIVEVGQGTYRSSPMQKLLWREWNKSLDYAEGLATAHNVDERILVLCGDMVEGDSKMRSTAIITRNLSTIINMSATTLAPLVQAFDSFYYVQGTEAHVGNSGELEHILADDLGLPAPVQELDLQVEGLHINVRHHTTAGGLPWTIDNAHSKWSNAVAMECAKNGNPVPDIAVRGHVHYFGTSGLQSKPFFVTLPCFQGHTDYTNRLAHKRTVSIGVFALHVEAGDWTPWYYVSETAKKKSKTVHKRSNK